MTDRVRIATRASQLALWQANHIATLIREASPATAVELIEVSTTGDRDQSQPLRAFGGLGVFTREVQRAVLDGRADVAVHSLKDLPTEPTSGLQLAAVPERAVTADALILPRGAAVIRDPRELSATARIGTGSPRRQAQLLYVCRSWQLSEVRGNVETRLRKLDDGEYDALVLACAGLTRLGLQDRISLPLSPPLMYPAVSQGAIGVECRSDDAASQRVLAQITHRPTWRAVLAERSLLATLRAGCHAPLGVNTTVVDAGLGLEAVVLTLDGSQRWTASAEGDDAVRLGQTVAGLLRDQGVERVLSST